MFKVVRGRLGWMESGGIFYENPCQGYKLNQIFPICCNLFTSNHDFLFCFHFIFTSSWKSKTVFQFFCNSGSHWSGENHQRTAWLHSNNFLSLTGTWVHSQTQLDFFLYCWQQLKGCWFLIRWVGGLVRWCGKVTLSASFHASNRLTNHAKLLRMKQFYSHSIEWTRVETELEQDFWF